MKLQPKADAPKENYPSFESHHLSRRGVVGGAAALLLASGCDRPEIIRHELGGFIPTPTPPSAETNAPAPTAESGCEAPETAATHQRPKPLKIRTRGIVRKPSLPEQKPTFKSLSITDQPSLPKPRLLGRPVITPPNIEVPDIDYPELPSVGLEIPAAETNHMVRLPGEVPGPKPPTPEG